MKPVRIVAATLSVSAACIVLVAAAVTAPPSEFISHTVKSGETISLLCIEMYGHYAAAMGEAFKADNPSVADINVIQVGQKLMFRNPDFKQASTRDTAAAQSTAAAEPRIFEKNLAVTQGAVTWVEGDVTFTSRNGGGAQKLSVNSLVYPGDMVQTGATGRIELIINRESVVRIRENTRITISSFRDLENNKGATQVAFSLGSVWTKMRKFKDKLTRFQLQMPTAIAGVHGTVYQTSIGADSSAQIKVYEGEVSVNNNAARGSSSLGTAEVSGPDEVPGPQEVNMETWTQIVRSMQQLHIDKKGVPSKPSTFTKNPKDTWEKWNEERDKRIAQMFSEI